MLQHSRSRVNWQLIIGTALIMNGCPSPSGCPHDTSALPEFFYYIAPQPGEYFKQPLELSISRLGICFDEGLTEPGKAAIVAGVPLLRPFEERQREFTEAWEQQRNYYVVRTRPCTSGAQVLGVMAELNATAGVKYASPVFESIDSGMANEVQAAISDTVPLEEVQALADLFHIELFDSLEFPAIGRIVYFFRLTDESRMNVLDMANTLHEHPLTDGATPEWLMLYSGFEIR